MQTSFEAKELPDHTGENPDEGNRTDRNRTAKKFLTSMDPEYQIEAAQKIIGRYSEALQELAK